MNLPYRTAQDAACALKERCFRNYHLLPYNWHDPTRNPTWWLSPATDRVAYRYGKAAFETNEKWVKPRHVFCGFWVEKGLVTGDAGGRHNEIMQPNWFWHRFVELAGGPLASKIEEARGALGHNLSLAVTAGILGAKRRGASLSLTWMARPWFAGPLLGRVTALWPALRHVPDWATSLRQ